MPNTYPQEFKERAIRLVDDRLNRPDAPSITAAIKEITTSDTAAEIRRLKRENAELRRANEILKTASA